MITDQEYKELSNRVSDLEKRLSYLTKKLDSVFLKNDISGFDNKPTANRSSEDRRRKDTTQYEFRGQLYSKRQLVLECIKAYVSDNGISSSSELIDVFPDYVQGTLGVFREVKAAEKYSDARRRFFFDDQDVIVLDDGVFVVCKQWDKDNIGSFLALAKDLGYEIVPRPKKY